MKKTKTPIFGSLNPNIQRNLYAACAIYQATDLFELIRNKTNIDILIDNYQALQVRKQMFVAKFTAFGPFDFYGLN